MYSFCANIGEGNLVEEHFHVRERADGHAALADFAFGECVIGVVAHQSGQIESGGEASLTLRKEIAEALVGVFGGPESRELAHGPEPAAVHRRMDAACVRRLAREAEVAVRVPIWQIRFGVQPANRVRGNRGEFGLALRTFFKSGLEGVFLPRLFFGGGLAMRGRSLCRWYRLCGSLGMFAHAHRSRGRNKTTIQIAREFNAIRKVRKGQGRRGGEQDKSTRLKRSAGRKNSRSGNNVGTGYFQRVDGCYLALYSLAVNSLWPTDCACLTVPFGAFPSSGHHR